MSMPVNDIQDLGFIIVYNKYFVAYLNAELSQISFRYC